jgi:RepB DNA-primase N-terminal domain/RepB DNA-primase C-terminal helical domain
MQMNGIAPRDRTREAMYAQTRAMGCEQFEVGLRDREGTMLSRTWTVPEIDNAMPWLKWQNVCHRDIYIRPAGSVGLILLDDLNSDALARMKHDGFPPAVIVETSPDNFQAWVRVSTEPLPTDLATSAARILAEVYGGDMNSADWRHFGRLAGFVNPKPKHRYLGGLSPYVRIRSATGAVATAAGPLLEEAAQRLLLQRIEPIQYAALPLAPAPDGSVSPGDLYRHYAARLLPLYPSPDWSRIDWMVGRDIAASSPYIDAEFVAAALREGSPNLTERKSGHVDDYVARTAEKVMSDPEVVTARARFNGHQRQLVH